MKLVNYLMFSGHCEEAIDFYTKKLDAQVLHMSRFSEMPPNDDPACQIPPGHEDKIMHATLKIGESELMMCDGFEPQETPFSGFYISIAADDLAQAKQYFDAIAEQGEVIMPLDETFWAQGFGMVKDKFGLGWMVNFEGDKMNH